MHEFQVWAPKAKNRVRVKVRGRLYPMEAGERGWWSATIEDASRGDDYAFLLDDDLTELPDPRGLEAVHGVHGPSRLYDQAAYKWNDRGWQGWPLASAVFYEIHIGTFTEAGTFDAAIERLPYLVELGVTHLELMPVAEFPGKFGWGYDGVGMFAVTETYGGPDGLKRLIDACHQHRLAVVLDVVYNHFGPVGAYANKFGPYLTDKHVTPWGDAMNFEEGGSDEVRRFFLDNAMMWLRDFHCDGLRLDATHEYMDRSAIHFMEQLSADVEVMSAVVGRRLVLIAESDLNNPDVVRPREAGGYGMDAQWSDDFHHALFTVLHKAESGKGYYDDFGSFELLAKTLTDVFAYDGQYSVYRDRSHGRPVTDLSAHHFIGFIQNHDQIGNRAIGDRIEHIVGMKRAKVAAGLVMTAPFLPMLFQGEEFASSAPFQYFAHHEDPEMAKAVSIGRKRDFAAFGWNEDEIPDPESDATFENSKLNWAEIHQGKHEEMLDWTRQLIRLRRCSPSLNDGDTGHVRLNYNSEQRWLHMRRNLVDVMLNLGEQEHSFDMPKRSSVVLSSSPEVEERDGKVVLPPDTLAILSREGQAIHSVELWP